MQTSSKKSIDFGQSQWLLRDVYAQQGGVRYNAQKGDKTFI